MYDLCQSLCYLHDNLIVHRDLRPVNILIDDGPRVRISHFGVMRALMGAEATEKSMVRTTDV